MKLELKPLSDFVSAMGYCTFPVGIILVATSGPQDNLLIGDEIGGCYDASYGDGGTPWHEVLHRYTGYYDFREVLGLIPKPEVDPFQDFASSSNPIHSIMGPGG